MQAKRQYMGKKEQMSSLLHAQHNGNFGRLHSAHRNDLLGMTRKGEGAKIVGFQELRRKLEIPGYETIQTDQHGHVGEALFIHHSIKILKAGVVDMALSNFGQAIGDRGIPWALVQLPNKQRELNICWHNVPLRMQDSPLDNVGEARVRGIIQRFRATPFVVHTDANELERRDPADLEKFYGAEWLGSRIDFQGWGRVPEGLLQWWEKNHPQRPDDHPTVYAANRRTVGLYELKNGKVVVNEEVAKKKEKKG